jgi:hypothetical protein
MVCVIDLTSAASHGPEGGGQLARATSGWGGAAQDGAEGAMAFLVGAGLFSWEGYGATLPLLRLKLLAHLFGNWAVVSLLSFVHGELASTQFALPM